METNEYMLYDHINDQLQLSKKKIGESPNFAISSPSYDIHRHTMVQAS